MANRVISTAKNTKSWILLNSLGKPVIFIKDSKSKNSIDIQHIRMITYDMGCLRLEHQRAISDFNILPKLPLRTHGGFLLIL